MTGIEKLTSIKLTGIEKLAVGIKDLRKANAALKSSIIRFKRPFSGGSDSFGALPSKRMAKSYLEQYAKKGIPVPKDEIGLPSMKILSPKGGGYKSLETTFKKMKKTSKELKSGKPVNKVSGLTPDDKKAISSLSDSDRGMVASNFRNISDRVTGKLKNMSGRDKEVLSRVALQHEAFELGTKKIIPTVYRHASPEVLLKEHNLVKGLKNYPGAKKAMIDIRKSTGESSLLGDIVPVKEAKTIWKTKEFEYGKSKRLSRHAIKRILEAAQ